MVASLTDNSPADWDIGYVIPVRFFDQPLNGVYSAYPNYADDQLANCT